jgi:hypothetical protein
VEAQSNTAVCNHYPAPENHIANDPTPKDQAIYVPSVSPGFATDVYAQNWKRELPKGVGSGDLNFLDTNNKLMGISHALTSAGQSMNQRKPCIINQRDRNATLIIGDSGGYQISTGRMHINGNQDRLNILRWLEETCDLAMTLDVPTGSRKKPGSKYYGKSNADCLKDTIEHLDFFQEHRVPGKIRWLNVLQGNNVRDSDDWYAAVKHYDFEGWAFAGYLRHDFFHFCRRLLEMCDDNLLQNKSWIHVLGTNELEAAILLTAFQRAINRHINPNLRISYDTSTPFRNLAWNNMFTLPTFDANTMTLPTRKAPDGLEFVGSQVKWPWPSALGNHMVMGDFCVPPGPNGQRYRDTQSNHYFAYHNVSALTWSIATANRVFDAENINHEHTIAKPVGAAVEAIENIFASGGSRQVLNKYHVTFNNLRHGSAPILADEDRDFNF